MSAVISLTAREFRVVASLASIFALRMLGLCMLLPVFALEAGNFSYANKQLIGVAIGAYGLTQALLQIPFGILSDRYGRLRIILLGLALLLLGSLIAASAQSIYGLIIGRVLQGTGAIGSVVIATLADNTREQVRTRAMAVLGISIGGAFVLAMILGPWITQVFGFRGVFWCTAGLAIGGILLLVISIPRSSNIQSYVKVASFRQTLTDILANHKLLSLNYGVFVLHTSLAAVFLVLPLLIQNSGYAPSNLWKLYFVALGVALPMAMSFITLGERREQIDLLQLLAVVGLLIAEIFLGVVNQKAGIFISLSLFFTAFCILEASLPTLVSKYAPTANRGAAMGVYSSLQFLGVFFGGIMGGWLHDRFGVLAVLLLCVGLAGTWLALAVILQEREKVKLNLVESK